MGLLFRKISFVTIMTVLAMCASGAMGGAVSRTEEPPPVFVQDKDAPQTTTVTEELPPPVATGTAAMEPTGPPPPAPMPTYRPNLNVMKIAHRGASVYAPENTIPAIEKAIDMGMDYVELDVRYTKDDVAVLMHDSSVDRTTNGSGKVADMTLDEFKKLDAGRGFAPAPDRFAGTPPPTLREALEVMKGRINLYYDQKEPMRDETIAMLREFGFFPNNMVITGGPDKNGELRARAADAPVMPNLESLDQLPELLKQLPAPRAFNTNCSNLTPEMVQAAHDEGVMVFTNTLGLCDMPTEMRKMIKMGPDAIQTDRPKDLIETIEKMKKKAEKADANQDSNDE